HDQQRQELQFVQRRPVADVAATRNADGCARRIHRERSRGSAIFFAGQHQEPHRELPADAGTKAQRNGAGMSVVEVLLGIDLGSTTTKAVALDRNGRIIGRGITNTRSNYEVASQIVRDEALVQSRFELVRHAMAADAELSGIEKKFIGSLVRNFRRRQHLEQLEWLESALHCCADAPRYAPNREAVKEMLNRICQAMRSRVPGHFSELAVRKSDFFRDLAAADYMQFAEQFSDSKHASFDVLCGLFDAAILVVENAAGEGAFERHAGPALEQTLAAAPPDIHEREARLRSAVESVRSIEIRVLGMV